MIRVLELAVRSAITAVFAYAGVTKVTDPTAFVSDVESFRLINAPLSVLVAAYLPWLEIAAAAALWVPRLRRGAAWLLLGLTVVFLVAIGSAWLRGLDLACGCFGAADSAARSSYRVLVLRDGLLLAALVFLVRMRAGSGARAGGSG